MKGTDYIGYLIAYLCTVDGFIHDEEVKMIEQYCSKYELNVDSREMIHKILGDTEDKISLESVLENIAKDSQIKRLAFEEVVSIAYADGFFDVMEEELIEKMVLITKFDKKELLDIKTKVMEKNNNKQEYDKSESLKDKIWKIGVSILRNVTTGKTKENLENEYKKFLLKGKEYRQTIEKMERIAQEDFKYVEIIMKSVNSSYQTLIHEIQRILKESEKYKDSENENEKKYYSVISNFQTDLQEIIIKRIEETNMAMTRKKRAIGYYTISFIGKTKAGKSTLHSIITGEGKEFIGKGQQRTTRFNRIYEWEKVRIIDTPGIGAPGGKTDEEIAKSVIEESDLICYVLKNDSVQESEFAFLKLIKEHNKPIIILLNVKENIENDVKLEMYLSEPNKWYERKDEKSLEGHFNRIRRYAEQHYNNNYFNIYPVQLLAAQMSQEEKYKDRSEILYKSSHIEDFLTEIRIQIIKDGILRKSQNILDGTIGLLNEASNVLKNNFDAFGEINFKIRNNKDEIIKKIESSYEDNKKNIESSLKLLFDELKEIHAREFANDNYETNNQEEIMDRWQEYTNNIGFNKNVEKTIENHFSKYQSDIKEYLKEAEQNFELINKIATSNFNFSLSSVVDTRGIVGILGRIAGAIGSFMILFSNPIGWFVAIGGAILSFFSGLFESKEEKVRKAINKLHNSIKENIETSEPDLKKQIVDSFSKNHKSIIKEIRSNFDLIINNIESVREKLDAEIKMVNQNMNTLNVAYGYRIVNYANNNKIELITENLEKTISVEREYGKKITIRSQKSYSKEVEEKLESILQEKVELIREKSN